MLALSLKTTCTHTQTFSERFSGALILTHGSSAPEMLTFPWSGLYAVHGVLSAAL